ncbi:MAG: phage terminase large subunit family protein [Sulfurovum sp.]|nr:phage terminase large subunit family protein [Sulfurovum sp.]
MATKKPKTATQIINESAKNKAPAFNKGLQGIDVKEFLANSDANDIRAVMARDFATWAAFSGIKVDGNPLEFESHRYLLPIYMDPGEHIVWMKAAQLGATVFLLLKLLWYCRNSEVRVRDGDGGFTSRGPNVSLYFPTGGGVEALSKGRLNPIITQNEELRSSVTEVDTLTMKQFRNIHDTISTLYMTYMGGTDSKDSTPLDVLAFDEVRLMGAGDIDQVQERFAHSPLKHQIYMSTAGFPGVDISSRFAQGTQLTFHSVCNCSTPVILPETFPDCVVERKKKDGTMETYYRCPKCKYRINDVQNGNYLAHNPSASYNSYSVSQLNSSHIKPADLFAFFKSTTNMKEFYNGKLGMPYVDENARPITDDVFNACIDETLHWQMDLPSHRVSGSCAMGVDQHSGNVYVTLLKRGKEGKKDIVHLEIVDDQNPIYWKYSEKFGRDVPVSPFIRLHEMMTEFNVGMCVIDLMPNANEAMTLARAFPGRVFTAVYRDTGQDMVSWADRPTSKQSTKKGSHYIKNKYQVTLNRYLTLDYSLKLWVDGVIAIPPVGKLLPLVKSRKKEDNGRFIATPIALILRDHLKCLVREEQVVDEATGKIKNVFIYLGTDPHSAHATNYACIAIERLRTGAFFIM